MQHINELRVVRMHYCIIVYTYMEMLSKQHGHIVVALVVYAATVFYMLVEWDVDKSLSIVHSQRTHRE